MQKEIQDIRLTVVDNGFKLCYSISEQVASTRTYDSCRYEYKELVYTDDQLQDALKMMLELRDRERAEDKEESDDPTEALLKNLSVKSKPTY